MYLEFDNLRSWTIVPLCDILTSNNLSLKKVKIPGHLEG